MLATAASSTPGASTGAVEAVSQSATVSPLPGAEERAQQTSGNILGFIGLQLQRDLQDGASGEALSSRVVAGLEGFKQGFTDAARQLSEMGLMSEELKAELQLTYNKVVAGMQELHQQFAGTGLELAAEDTDPLASVAISAPTAGYAGGPIQPEREMSSTSRDDFRRYATEQLLGQREGVDALLAYLETMEVASDPAAVNHLMEKVAKLAASYQSTGVQQAFDEAASLGYGDQDIGRFVQQLLQPSVQRAQQAYGDVQSDATISALADRLQPLVHYAQELRDTQLAASRLQQPDDLLMRMTEVVSASSDTGFQRITAALLQAQAGDA